MVRLSVVFIAVCVVLIGASLGFVSFLVFRLSPTQSALVALSIMAALALYNMISSRLRDHSNVGDQIADLSRASADVARQVSELSRRIAAVENARASAPPPPQPDKALILEIGELGVLVKQLAETVATHEAQLAAQSAVESPPAAASPPSTVSSSADNPDSVRAEPSLAANGKSEEDRVAQIRDAIEANRIDLYLQPIVTLPQRKVRYYEALTRLRTEQGALLTPAEFIPAAERAGLMPKIDNLILFRTMQVVRRLLTKNRDVGLFCNLSAVTLSDPDAFAEVSQFLEANRAIAPSLILEIQQDVWRNVGPIETANLSALAEHGYRYSMDHVGDLRVEPRDLVERGIRFIKVPGTLLLDRDQRPFMDIHAADLSDLLGRHGISLIAEKIEAEGMVVDLLDFDVRFGQGQLFSAPRPVRAEALQTPVEREERAPAPAEPALRALATASVLRGAVSG
ncbi:MAG: EAL domain-containing protein [Pseudorhodoplanes sp.]